MTPFERTHNHPQEENIVVRAITAPEEGLRGTETWTWYHSVTSNLRLNWRRLLCGHCAQIVHADVQGVMVSPMIRTVVVVVVNIVVMVEDVRGSRHSHVGKNPLIEVFVDSIRPCERVAFCTLQNLRSVINM
jgi:hypothetical protein